MTFPQNRLLVVDDDANHRAALSRRLEGQGYAVEVAADSSDALAKINQAHYDLVLLDQVLPGRGALDLLRLLRATYSASELPVIMVTAVDQNHAALEALKGGANDYLTWPVDMPVAAARIEAQLSRSKSERQLRAIEQRDAKLAWGTDHGIWNWDLISNKIHISSAWGEQMGLPHGQDQGPAFWLSLIHPDDRNRVKKEFRATLSHPAGELHVEFRMGCITASQCRRVLVRGSILRSAEGAPVRWAGSIADLTPVNLLDPLTGLGTRQFMLERIGSIAAMSPLAILLLDLDGFKLMNDSFGHVFGDRILKEVAGRVRNTVADLDPRETTAISRIGGDEFTVLLKGPAAPGRATELAEKLLATVKRPILIDDFQISIGASLGVVVEGSSHSKPHDVLRDAELAMYHAKELGRDRWQMFEPSRRELVYTRMSMVHDLQYATERNQLLAVYQPKIDLRSRKIVGFEALLRWRHPERGLLMPVDFIPLAEETGFIVPMGEWILRTACRQLRTWQATFPALSPLSMNVNLSVKQLGDPHLVNHVRLILQDTNIALGTLKLELTESTLMTDLDAARNVLEQLQAMHIGLKLDDFGTGYSSLSCLRALRFDSLKIDRSFVAKLESDREARAIVDTIIRLAHTLDMTVVAEGIEETAQVAELVRMGCDFGQGYHFSRPVEAAAAERLLRESAGSGQTLLVPPPARPEIPGTGWVQASRLPEHALPLAQDQFDQIQCDG